jgi:hypothetical protein
MYCDDCPEKTSCLDGQPCWKVKLTRERYDELIDAEKTLEDLYARGVDNWEGF